MSELPDLDEDVSFVVDNGASVGPTTMRAIIDSIASGQRDASSLVWWQGATDWVRFDSRSDLKELIAPATDETEATRWDTPQEALAEPAPTVASPTPTPTPTNVDLHDDQPVEAFDAEPIGNGVGFFGSAAFDEAAPAAELAPVEELAPAAEPTVTEASEFSFNLPTREVSEIDEPAPPRPLTGLFSSGARTEPTDSDNSQMPSPDALDAILAARQSLESVGARIEALSSATRRSLSPEELKDLEAVASLPDGQWTEVGAQAASPQPEPAVAEVASTEVVAAQPEVAQAPAAATTAGSWTSVGEEPAEAASRNDSESPEAARAQLTERFDEMVRKSVAHQRRIEWIMRVDELLLSSCITAIADSGYSALDLNSRDSDHRVIFDHNNDSRRVQLDLSPVDAVSESFGRHVRFGLSWGRDVAQPDRAFEIVRQHATDGPNPPGVVTCEADMATGSVSTRVELIFAADDFVKDDYSVDRASLDSSIAATLHALEQRWHELFG